MLQYRFILIILFGFLFIPGQVTACGINTVPVSESGYKAEFSKKEYCNGCEGCNSRQNRKNCTEQCKCLSCCTTTLLPDSQNLSFEKKMYYNRSSFINPEYNISKGFLFIWLTPKIG
ncbi:hypothetical protein BAX99_17245 [Elizabethkingia miricola]|nr:hypothetical protein BAX99_17245 [Elizabethkingia miricola]